MQCTNKGNYMNKDKKKRITKEQDFNLRRTNLIYRLQFLVTAIIAFSIIFGSFMFVYNISKEVNVSKRRTEAISVAHEIEFYLMKNMEKLNLLAENIENMLLQGDSGEDIELYMIQETRSNTRVVDSEFLGVYGLVSGQLLDGTYFTYGSDYDPTIRPWYTAAKDNPLSVTLVPPYTDAKTGKIVFSVSKLLSDGESVVAIDIYNDYLQSMVETYALAGTGHLMITDQNGIIISCEDKNVIGKSMFKARNDQEKALTDAIYDNKGKVTSVQFEDTEYLFFSETISGQWNVIMLVDKNYIFGNLWYIFPLCLVVNGIAIFIIVIFFSKFNQKRLEAEEINNKLSAVADIYICMYDINLVTDQFVEIKSKPYIKYILDSHKGNASTAIPGMMKDLSAEESQAEINEFVNLEKLNERLKDTDTIIQEFRGIINYARARFIVQKRDALGNVIRVLFLIENIGAEVAKRKELLKVANTDDLTQMPNRRAWDEALSDFRQMKEMDDLTVITLDVNGLKTVNDTIGHHAGDELLIAAADKIKTYFSQYGEVFRIGGDEFAIITSDITPRKDRMKKEFLKLVSEWSGQYCKSLSISVGIARGNEEIVDNVDDLVKIADKYMYEDKAKYYEDLAANQMHV